MSMLPTLTREDVAAFGELELYFAESDVPVPLRFLVTRAEDGFDAQCIELCVSGFAKDFKYAMATMARDIVLFANRSQERFLAELKLPHSDVLENMYYEMSVTGSAGHNNWSASQEQLDVLQDAIHALVDEACEHLEACREGVRGYGHARQKLQLYSPQQALDALLCA